MTSISLGVNRTPLITLKLHEEVSFVLIVTFTIIGVGEYHLHYNDGIL